ncbi:protein kinase domain [Microscilla marina ATCC 23134]|uniref:Protein kinase domain n=2 Tax=Microscilla marina TaxID=1027 RepID=A1ZP78_MICM2|nr:protein kinase domain [Microscilla marina ATCC 23134]
MPDQRCYTMKKLTVYTSDQIPILLENPPLGQGGEGVVYKTRNARLNGNFVAKIYHPQERTDLREPKIKYLIEHAPQLEVTNSAIFPEQPLYNQAGEFVGFLMKQTIDQVDITSLCSLTPSAKLNASWHKKYHRYTAQGVGNRLKVCYNIAQAFAQLHQSGKFVFVDIKPENIKLTYDGTVSLIDIDSIQIAENNQLLFAAQKLTHEYSPAEIAQLDFKKEYVPQHWDRFSLAVVFYKILFGLHPYTGSCQPPFDQHVTNEQKIAKGLFVHGRQKKHFKVIPTPHQNFKLISRKLQQLFLRAFEEGHQQPDKRPTMHEWMEVLTQTKAFEFKSTHTVQNWELQPLSSAHSNVQAGVLSSPSPQVVNSAWQTLQVKLNKNIRLVGMVSILVGAGIIFGIANSSLSFNSSDAPASERMLTMGTFHDGVAWQKYSKDSYIYVDRWDKWAINETFEEAYDFADGTAKVKKRGKYGFISLQGRQVVPFEYDYIEGTTLPTGKRLLKVGQGNKFGLINRNGERVLPIIYDNVWYNSKTGVIELQKGTKFGLYDHEGVELAPFRYKSRQEMKQQTKRLLKLYHSIK